MVKDYETRQVNDNTQSHEVQKESPRSLRIYEKAAACYRPEIGESNAESAKRHRLIEERVMKLKTERLRQEGNSNEPPPRLPTLFPTSRTTNSLINIRQHRTTKRRRDLNQKQRAHEQQSN